MTHPKHDTTPYPADVFGLDPDTMRRLGYAMVDTVVDRLSQRQQERALTTADPASLRDLLGGPLPEQPGNIDADMALLIDVALATQQHADHPRYFSRVPSPAAYSAMLGEWLGTGFNTIAASWGGGAGPAMLELVVMDWLAQLLGLPVQTEGVLVSGGSLANLTAFAVARNERGGGVAYLSDQAHASLKRDLYALGGTADTVRVLPSDAACRLDVAMLREAIARDLSAGGKPWLVVASAGTTNTGAVDPLPELAALCAEYGLWLHVDGAYGAPAALTDDGRAAMPGLALADSWVVDPHKWLFQPYDVGACLVRHPGALERCFAMSPEYLRDVQSTTGAINFGNRSLELSRRSRAVKLWLSLKAHGAGHFRDAVQRGIDLARYTEQCLLANPTVWEVISPAQIGIICFALRGADAATHTHCANTVTESGFASLTTTELKGRSALRLCTINPLTRESDIDETLRRLAASQR